MRCPPRATLFPYTTLFRSRTGRGVKELLLGLRLLLGSGRGNRTRFVLMAVGGSLGVCCLAIVLAIPGIIAAQDGRIAGRQPEIGKHTSELQSHVNLVCRLL